MMSWREWLAWGLDHIRASVLTVLTSHVLWSSLLVSGASSLATVAVGVTYHDPLRGWLEAHNFIAPIAVAAAPPQIIVEDKSKLVLSQVQLLAGDLKARMDALDKSLKDTRVDLAELRKATSDDNLKLPERVGVVTRAALQSVIVVRREPMKPATAVKATAP